MSYYKASYTAGEEFIDYSGNKYTVITGGTTPTTPFDKDNVVGGYIVWGSLELKEDDSGGISMWATSTMYDVDDVVIYNDLIYQCITAHTSTNIFDPTKWICLSGKDVGTYAKRELIWEGSYSISNQSATSFTNTLELPTSIEHYDQLEITVNAKQITNENNYSVDVFDVSDITYGEASIRTSISNDNSNASFLCGFSDSTHFGICFKDITNWTDAKITKIVGVKFNNSVVSSGMKYETLWSGSAGSPSGSVNLVSSCKKYQKLGFLLDCTIGGANNCYYKEILVSDYINMLGSNYMYSFNRGYGSDSDYFVINCVNSTDITISYVANSTTITKIIGISEGVQIPTGVQASRVTLFEGEYNTVNNSSTVLPNTLQISDSIEHYDCLEFTINGFKTTNENNYMTSIVDIKDITYNEASFRITASYYDHYSSFLCTFTDSTHFAICHNDKNIWTDGKITKITGIKYIQPDSYSTEEKLIGTWIDGKPLYQITIVADTLINSSETDIFSLLDYNVDKLVCVDGILYAWDDNIAGIPRNGLASNNIFIDWGVTSQKAFRIYLGAYYYNNHTNTCYITIKYTKTTT